MRLPRVRLTLRRILVAAAVLSLAAGGIIVQRETLGEAQFLVIGTLALAWPFLLLLIALVDVLSLDRHHRGRDQGPTTSSESTRRPRLTVLQMMAAMGIVAAMCWAAVTITPLWWAVFHRPTNAEIAARMREDAARWKRMSIEHPSLAKEYQRLSDKSNRAADRLDPRAKRTSP